MSTSQLSSNPTPYSALLNKAEEPLHFNDPHTPFPSYSSDEKVASMNPYSIDGTPRTQLEFYHKELTRLRGENAKLREENREVWWMRTDFVKALRSFSNFCALLSVVSWIIWLMVYLFEKKQTC